MKILYLHWGGNSGVVASVSRELSVRGHNVIGRDLGLILSPKRAWHRWDVVKHFAYTYSRYGARWKERYAGTVRAFNLISRTAQQEVDAVAPDAILQSGARFGVNPGRVPYVVYVDHTRMISERYPAVAGIPAPGKFGSEWLQLERQVYLASTRICTFSHHAANSFQVDYGIDPAKVKAVGAGPNLPDLPGVRRDTANGKTVLAVGVAPEAKGFPTLEAAFKIVRHSHPSARLLLVGADGVNSPGISYLGRLPRSAMPEVYQRADVFALPTLREAFGISYVEAMAYGLPCIGSDLEAIPEIIDDGVSGFVLPPLDTGRWAEKLGWLLSNPDQARQMGLSGREKVLSIYNWSAVCDQLETEFSI